MLRLGIVGWGYWGRNYAKYLDTSIDARLECVCDVRDLMLEDACKRFPHIRTTKHISDLSQKNIDAAIISTPASSHFALAKYFLNKNIPLLIEKPLTNSISDAQALLALARKNKIKVLTGHTFLYNQAVIWIKNKIDHNYFGKMYYLEFKRQSYGPIRDDVNIVWDFAPHDLSMCTWFLNNRYPKYIYAKAKSFSRNSQEDIAIITLEYPNNVLVNINVAWLYPIKIRTMVMLGSKRMVVFEDTNATEPIRVYNTSVKYPSESESYKAAFRLGDVIIPRIQPVDPLYSQMKHFVEYIKGNTAPISGIDDGLKNVLLLEAINKSIKSKKEIDFQKIIDKGA